MRKDNKRKKRQRRSRHNRNGSDGADYTPCPAQKRRRREHDEEHTGLLSPEEERRLIMAAVTARIPEPSTDDDIAPVWDWGTNARIGQHLVGLMLEGQIVPAGFKADDEPGFIATSVARPSRELKQFRAEVKRTPVSLNDRGLRLLLHVTGEEPGDLVTPAEKQRLRLAIAVGMGPSRCAKADERRVLDWVEECALDEGRLWAVLIGHLLPTADAKGQFSFRPAEELAEADFDNYQAGLKLTKRDARMTDSESGQFSDERAIACCLYHTHGCARSRGNE